MANQITFRDGGVEAALKQRAEEGQSVGLTARRTLTRYFDAVAREQERLGFTAEELTLLSAATVSRLFGEQGPYYIHYGVLDAAESGDLQAFESASISGLVAKLKALTPMQELALLDLLEQQRSHG